MSQTPTEEFYTALQHAYRFFNDRLFDGVLSECLITVQREKNVMGYFSFKRWASTSKEKGVVHEIALNPSYFAQYPLREVLQTIVHEQCHLWQFEHGSPGRRGYHNKEWADKMESIGLMPSSTGAPGGKRTGEKMADYCVRGGRFEQVCLELMRERFELPWVDRKIATSAPPILHGYDSSTGIDETPISEEATELAELLNQSVADLVPNIVPEAEQQEEIVAEAKKKQKIKYSCSGCKANVWGKPNLRVTCDDCNQSFAEAV